MSSSVGVEISDRIYMMYRIRKKEYYTFTEGAAPRFSLSDLFNSYLVDLVNPV
jgi:hypothetical protein